MSKGIKRKIAIAKANINKALSQLVGSNEGVEPIPLEVVLKSEHLNAYGDALSDVSS